MGALWGSQDGSGALSHQLPGGCRRAGVPVCRRAGVKLRLKRRKPRQQKARPCGRAKISRGSQSKRRGSLQVGRLGCQNLRLVPEPLSGSKAQEIRLHILQQSQRLQTGFAVTL
jgi:hypothetical protein